MPQSRQKILPRSFSVFIGLILWILLFVGLFVWRVDYCERRVSIEPTFLRYSQMNEISYETTWDAPKIGGYRIIFNSGQHHDEVLSYYDSHLSCVDEKFNERIRCFGQAIPFGQYTVTIEYTDFENETRIQVDTVWDRCGEGLLDLDNPG